MNPTDLIQSIFSIAKAIHTQVQTVKENRKKCQRLAERIDLVIQAVKGLEIKENKDHYVKGLEKLKECLEECQKFISQFSQKHWLRKAVLAKSYQEKFAEFNEQLLEAANLLQLGLVANLVDQAQDQQDREQDKKDMVKNQDDLLRQLHMEQQELQDIKMNQEQLKQVLIDQEQSFKLYLRDLAASPIPKQSEYPIPKHDIIPYCQLLVNEVIDEGTFGIVYRGTWLEQPVAIKKLKHLDAASKNEFIHEVQILSRLKSPYIVQFMGACFEEGYQSIVMEYMAKDSLAKYLQKIQNTVTPQQQKQWIFEIASGLKYLHDSGHIHRDLKSANILIDNDSHAKLADFGLTKSSSSSVMTIRKESEALAWMAPEIINRAGGYTPQSDIYSFGIVVWEIITRLSPGTNEEAANRARAKQSLSIPKNVPEIYIKLIESCLKAKPEERPALADIIRMIQSYQPPQAVSPASSPSSTATNENGESLCLKGMDFERRGNDNQARIYYEKSAAQNYSRGLNNLGMFTVQGRGGLTTNKAKGFELIRRAAEQGLARAQLNAGVMLASGDGVTKDIPKAIEWFSKSAAQGNEEAKKQLAIYQPYQANLETSFGK